MIFLNKWWKRVYGDMMGGTTAAIVALPLALAFGIASGAGAEAGLYASIFGGLAAAIFGGCGVQITGPTGAMTVVLVGIIKKYGISGMLLAGVLAGLMQIVFGLLRMGGFVKYLPRPVIAGFTNGVSILFFITAIDDAIETVSITAITAAVILLALRFFKRVPESLFGRSVYIVGLNRKPMRILIRMGIIDSRGRDRVFRKIENTVKKAFEEISQDEGDKFALELFGEA